MGAGRTEVARAIFGADKVDGGEVFVHGRKTRIRQPQDAVDAGIGYLSEDRKHFGLAVGMDVRNNIAMASLSRFAGPGGLLSEAAMHDAAVGYIDRLSIKTPSDSQEVRLLSGGNQQKVVIAKWLLRDCDVLIFDEPTRGIDVGAKSEVYRLLNSLAAEGQRHHRHFLRIARDTASQPPHRRHVRGPADRHPAGAAPRRRRSCGWPRSARAACVTTDEQPAKELLQ